MKIIIAVLIVGFFPASCRRVARALLSAPARSLRSAIARREARADADRRERELRRSLFDGLDDAQARSLVPGSLVASLAFAFFVVIDAGAVVLTFGPLLQIPVRQSWFEENLAIAMGMAVVVPSVFAYWVSFECSQPNLLRTAAMLPSQRTHLARLGRVVIVLCVAELIALGVFRADALTTSTTEPSMVSAMTLYVISILLVVSLALATKLAWIVGPTTLLGLGALRAAMPPVKSVGLVLRWSARALSAVEQLGLPLYGILESLAQMCVHWLVVPLEYASRRARGEAVDLSLGAVVALAASDWINKREHVDGDLEEDVPASPDERVGHRAEDRHVRRLAQPTDGARRSA